MKMYCCFFTLWVLVLLVNGNQVPEGQSGKHVLCYFEGESAVKPQDEVRFVPEDLDLNICTHVVYNRAEVGEDLRVKPRDRDVNLSEDDELGLLQRTVALKERKPGLKVLLDLYDDGVLNKEAVTNSSEALRTFARNVADFIKTQGFDGVDFRDRNGEAFENAVPLLHEELSRRGLILMTFLLPQEPESEMKYDMSEEFSRNFDLIAVGSHWMFLRPETAIFSSTKELERVISDYTASGIPLEKLVVAVPAFCVFLKLCDREDNGINSSACDPEDEGTNEPPENILYHSQVLRKIANATEEWVVVRDEESGGQYGYSKTLQWTSFEDPMSVRAKAALVLERNMAGIAIMNNDMEDFKGAYTENGETFPLTRAAYNAFYGES